MALLGYMSTPALAKHYYRDFGNGDSLIQFDLEDDAMAVMYPGDPIMGWYEPWHSDPEGEGDYTRVVPSHFADGTDVFMRSMVNTYALEEKACEEAEDGSAINC